MSAVYVEPPEVRSARLQREQDERLAVLERTWRTHREKNKALADAQEKPSWSAFRRFVK